MGKKAEDFGELIFDHQLKRVTPKTRSCNKVHLINVRSLDRQFFPFGVWQFTSTNSKQSHMVHVTFALNETEEKERQSLS